MKSAARLVPSFRQVLRAPVAGPSRQLRFASTEAAPVAAAEESALPPNISFEDVSGARKAVGNALLARGERLHIRPEDPFEPITHPLSSLSSLTPTQPATSGAAVALPAEIFAKPIRKDILHRNVVWYLSTLREGNQSTKTRSTVAYSGKKIRPQKGSGKARAGDRSSGTRRGGAPIHALKPRDWAQDLPRKVRKLGLETALSSKLSAGLLRIVEDLSEANWDGTREAVSALGDGLVEGEAETVFVERFGPKKDLSILFLYAPDADPAKIDKLYQNLRNVPNVELLATDEVVAYDVLNYRWVVADAAAVDALAADEMVYDFDPALEAEFNAQFDAAEAAAPEVTKVDLGAAQ